MGGLFGGNSSTSTSETALNSVSLQQSTYGLAVSIPFGRNRASGNLIDHMDFTAIPHTTTQTSGGKGGGKHTSSHTTYTYEVALMIAIGEGVITGIGTVWEGSNKTSLGHLNLELYKGTLTQNAWPYLTSKHPERAIPYRGVAYVASSKYDLGSSSSLPNLSFEYIGIGANPLYNYDAIPTEVITTILTHPYYGAGFPVEMIGDMTQLYNYTMAVGIFFSPWISSQKECQEYITDFAQITNSQPVVSQGKLKMVPYSLESASGNGVNYVASNNPQYTLTEDDFLSEEGQDPIELTRSDTADAFNFQQLEYSDRDNEYNVVSVEADDLANIELVGLRTADVVSARSICDRRVAKIVVQNILNRNLYQRNIYTIRLSWKYCLLEPMDLVSLIYEWLGLDNTLCRVISIEDSDDMELTVRVEEVYGSTSGVTIHPSQSADRGAIAYNVDPGNINTPIIFNPPSEITDTGLECWMAVSGKDMDNWGGCTVWVSTEESEIYKSVGQIQGPARMGSLIDQLELTGGFTTKLLSTDPLLGGSVTDSQNLNTLCYVGGELLAYESSTLTGVNTYRLDGLTRGAYQTQKSVHVIGSRFARLDNAIFKHPFTQKQLNQTLYFKFTSFNVFGGSEQSLADVVAYQHTMVKGEVPQVTDVYIDQHLRGVGDGTNLYELEVHWTVPNTTIYSYSDIYLKSSQPNINEIGMTWDEMPPGVTFDDMSGTDVWKYIGKAYDNITIPGCVTGQIFTVKVQAVSTQQAFKADFENAPEYTHEVKITSYLPLTPQELVVSFTEVCTWSWKTSGSSDNDYFELRMDMYPGQLANKLVQTSSIRAVALPPSRDGTVYLYGHNRSGHYSAPATYTYSKPKPLAPVVTVKPIFQGLLITCGALPNYGLGINVHIDDVVYSSPNNSYTFKSMGGIYNVRVAYVDLFGEGELSKEVTVTVEPTLNPEYLAAESISLEKMDSVIKDAVEMAQNGVSGVEFNQTVNQLTQATDKNSSQITQQAGQITQIVSDLHDANTAIAQNSDAIQLRATKSNLISLINVCPETITISSKLVHITGDTLFDDNVIVNRMIKAGAITTEKLSAGAITADKIAAGAITSETLGVTELSAITAKIGTLRTATTGARTEIKDNLIQVYDANNVLRVRMGVW